MKKIIIALTGIALLFSACTKNELAQLDQNPYRITVDYTPGTCELTVAGALSADEAYDWITVSQSGDKASFTLRRNTTGKVRTAVFTMAGSSYKAKVFQKAHSLDAQVSASIVGQGLGYAEVVVNFKTSNIDDYAGWGVLYSKTSDISSANVFAQKGVPSIGKNNVKLTGLEEGFDYYIWGFVSSTEGDIISSDLVALISPVYVQAGDDLQSAIDNAKEYAEIRVQGGVTFTGGVKMMNNNANKTVSGGWDNTFSKQSMDNLTIIDGGGSNCGFLCSGDENDNPLTQGYVNISYFEIKNCKFSHGSAVHVCGGPVTVHHCYVHDNNCDKGAIGTREEDFSSTITVYNCIVSDNYAKDGHGAAFGFGDGASYEDQVHATLVSNLIINNNNKTFDGYASTFICYNCTELIFVNNTVVGNMNFNEYGGAYSGLVLRGNVRALFANNLIVGNFASENLDTPVYYRQEQHVNFGGGWGTLANNIIEGSIKESENATFKNNMFPNVGFDLSTVITNDYYPVGSAVGFGTLDQISYICGEDRDHGATFTCSIKDLLEVYNTDLAGNPRVVGGKVDAGCYQAQ